MVRRFDQITGRYIEKIIGQDRLAYAHSDTNDLYDLVEWAQRGGYPGSVILFYDFENGNVYQPFSKKHDVVYGNPVYAQGSYYFLRADYDEKTVTLYAYQPGEIPRPVTQFSTDEVNLYNLRIVGNPVHIVSHQDERFECYYPQRFSFASDGRESVQFIEDGRIYMEKWVEEGWDEQNHRATDRYQYYDMVIVRDYAGNVVSEEIGSLYQAPDGTWWIT